MSKTPYLKKYFIISFELLHGIQLFGIYCQFYLNYDFTL